MVTCSLLLKNFWTQKELGINSYLTKVHDCNQQSETILNNFLTGTLGNLSMEREWDYTILDKQPILSSETINVAAESFGSPFIYFTLCVHSSRGPSGSIIFCRMIRF